MELDSNYWNNRYIHNDSPWDIGEISRPLKNYFDRLRNKDLRILIPGAGNAYEAEYLLKQGFKNVYVLDISEEAVKSFKARFPAFPAGHIFTEDFFKHRGQYDLIVEQTFFCAIDPALRQHYVQKMNELLAKGGRLAGLLFEDKNLKGNPPFGGTREEYLPIFQQHFSINTFDLCRDSIKPRAGRELFIEVEKA